MPNWCDTEINIYCKSKKDATEVFNTLSEWLNSDLYKMTGFGQEWLGRFLIQAGITTYDEIDRCDISCRGRIYDLHQEEEIIEIGTETAWCPMLKMWKVIVDKHFSEKVENILYVSKEPGVGLFYTNDEDWAGEYVMDCPDADLSVYDDNPTCFICDYLISFLEEKGICVESGDFESLEKELDYLDINYYSYKFEYVPIEDLD